MMARTIRSQWLAVLSLCALFALGLYGGGRWNPLAVRAVLGQEPATRPADAESHWLAASESARRDQLERHLRGLDVAMVEIGYRFNELHFAGQDRNWPYAQYQIEKIELAMQLALERRPKRAASARPFMQETIPLVKQAIKAATAGNRTDTYEAALERLRTDCMKCHVAENVPHFTVHLGRHRAAPINANNDGNEEKEKDDGD